MDSTSLDVVENAWRRQSLFQKEAQKTTHGLYQMARAFQRWNKQHFGYSFERIKWLEDQLLHLQKEDQLDREKIKVVEADLREQRAR